MKVKMKVKMKERGIREKMNEEGMTLPHGKEYRAAYMTLEACFIMPIAVILTAFLLILSFYIYTVCFLNQAAYIAAFRASLMEGADYAREEKAGEELEKLLAEALIRLLETQKEITASASGVTVALTAAWSLPGLSILPAEVGTLSVEAEKKALVRDAPAFIRGIRKLAGIGEGG